MEHARYLDANEKATTTNHGQSRREIKTKP
jgi:hypothetical protein